MKLAYQFAESNGLTHPFSRENEKAGQSWWLRFRERNPEITIRKPQLLSVYRAVKMNHRVIDKFFEMLEEIYEESGVFGNPARIYNTDESGLSLVPGAMKVVGERGKRDSNMISTAERGELITVLVTCNAAGDFVPPCVIYKGVRLNPALRDNLPPGTLVLNSPTGYMNTELFLQWMMHFSAHRRGSGKTVLIVDGHKSHTMSLDILEYAKASDIELVSFPSHTTHALQPMDRVFYKPLKDYYKEEVRVFNRNNPGRLFRKDDFPRLFCNSYLKVATMKNAITSFKCTGLYPLDKEVLPDSWFAPSEGMIVNEEGPADDPHSHVQTTSRSAEEGPADDDNDGMDVSFENLLSVPKPVKREKSKRRYFESGSKHLTSSAYMSDLAKYKDKTDLPTTSRSVGSSRDQKKPAQKKPAEKKPAQKKPMKEKRCQKNYDDPANFCGGCDGNYYDDVDLDAEEWIQCQTCNVWYHEICAGVYGQDTRSFICRDCL